MEDGVKLILSLLLIIGVLGIVAVIGYIIMPWLEKQGWL